MTKHPQGRRLFGLVAVSLIVAWLLPGCVPALFAPPLTLTVVHTNDTWGYLEPCG